MRLIARPPDTTSAHTSHRRATAARRRRHALRATPCRRDRGRDRSAIRRAPGDRIARFGFDVRRPIHACTRVAFSSSACMTTRSAVSTSGYVDAAEIDSRRNRASNCASVRPTCFARVCPPRRSSRCRSTFHLSAGCGASRGWLARGAAPFVASSAGDGAGALATGGGDCGRRFLRLRRTRREADGIRERQRPQHPGRRSSQAVPGARYPVPDSFLGSVHRSTFSVRQLPEGRHPASARVLRCIHLHTSYRT